MTEVIKILKADITEVLFKTNDIGLLRAVYNKLKSIESNKEKASKPSFLEAVVTVKNKSSLEQIKKSQNYKRIDYKKYRSTVDEIKWNQSLDELLEALN